MRAQTPAPIIILGLLPASEEYYPSYRDRAIAWGTDLAAALHNPEGGCFYVDLHSALTRGRSTDGLLLRDGRPLSIEAHRRIAEIVRPVLTQLMSGSDARAVP